MNFARSPKHLASARALLFTTTVVLAPTAGIAHETGSSHVHFQKPSTGKSAAAPAQTNGALEFRSSSASKAVREPAGEPASATGGPVEPAARQEVAKPLSTAPRDAKSQAVEQAPAQNDARPAFAQPSLGPGDLTDYREGHRDQRVVSLAYNQPLFSAPRRRSAGILDTGFGDCLGCDDPACGVIEPACGCGEPSCGICEPACGLEEPACGMEPECGIIEPGCGVIEPGCGLEPSCACGDPDCGDVGCGACVGRPGPDYWCFPICLPRFKELNVWGGVHGFKGPRDSDDFNGPNDNNFGFQEGVNIGGRAPLVGLIFPQLSYQLGYQSVQSQLSGTSAGSTEDRLQQFVTGGLFRRVPAGLQFGAVWDYMRDDLMEEENFQQMRYEISLKSQGGREIGFWGATHTDSSFVGAHEFQTVDQYCGFFRCHFRDAGELRFWGGGTNDNEGIFGADAYVPFSPRWSLQTGFNYLIPEPDPGPDGAREESWNVGINLVWHYGMTAKKSRTNPHRPLFSTADNGWMFIDARP